MDGVDRTLVDALRSNARASYAELGRLVGLSGPSVADRVRGLEQAGVIAGYHAAVSAQALGLRVTALVGIVVSDSADHDEVAGALCDVNEIEDCWFIAGEASFMAKVRVPDVDALERTIGRLSRIDGVARTHTKVVLSTRWESRFPDVGEPLLDRSEEGEPEEPADDGPFEAAGEAASDGRVAELPAGAGDSAGDSAGDPADDPATPRHDAREPE